MPWLLLAAAAGAADRPLDTWNLADLYPSIRVWEADLASAGRNIDALAPCKGHVAERIGPCLEELFATKKQVELVYAYAHLGADADTRDATWQARQQQAELLASHFAEGSAFFAPEIVAMGHERVEAAIFGDKTLAAYDTWLRGLVKDAPHTLDPASETLLASTMNVLASPQRTRDTFIGAELPWPTVQLSDGSLVELTPANFAAARSNPSRDDRKRVFDRFFGQLKSYEATLGTTLDAAVQSHWILARAHHYDTSMAAALDRDHLPPAVYEQLVARTNANLPTLQRYLTLRRQMLGVDKLAYHDLYVPLVSRTQSWTLDEARQRVQDATRPLGPEYQAALKQGFEGGWMDAMARPGKRPGAYMDGSATDVHPYMLLNYTGDYDSVSTLAHEWGHAMHSVLSARSQPYAKAQYSTFIAEIASTFNEALLLENMVRSAKSDDEKLYYLGMALENLRTTYFRQALFAEFELALHKRAEAGEPLTGAKISEIYLELARRYYGADTVDAAYATEWAYVGHFYYDFYVWQYATSIAASSLLAQDVMAQRQGALDRYLTLLKSGGSDEPYVLLKRGGVDLASPEPYDALAARMNHIMDDIEAIRARR